MESLLLIVLPSFLFSCHLLSPEWYETLLSFLLYISQIVIFYRVTLWGPEEGLLHLRKNRPPVSASYRKRRQQKGKYVKSYLGALWKELLRTNTYWGEWNGGLLPNSRYNISNISWLKYWLHTFMYYGAYRMPVGSTLYIIFTTFYMKIKDNIKIEQKLIDPTSFLAVIHAKLITNKTSRNVWEKWNLISKASTWNEHFFYSCTLCS